jgi:hypothetical protein
MKKTIISFIIGLCCFSTFTNAQNVLLNTDFASIPAPFAAVGDGDSSPRVYDNSVQNGFTFSNVALQPEKVNKGYTGRVILQRGDRESSGIYPGSIEFPAIESAGMVTIAAIAGSADKTFKLQKKTGSAWEDLTTFTIGNVDAETLTCNVQEQNQCILRLINSSGSDIQIFEVSVTAYESGSGAGEYVSKEIVHEQFNTSPWEEKAAGNYTFTIPVDAGSGVVTLTNCLVQLTGTISGASSVGRIRTVDATSIIELPEVPSCGSITLNMNAGSDNKLFTLEKKTGSSWVTVTTFAVNVAVSTVSYEVKSETPVTFRLTTNTGAKNIYELWITDYVKKAETAIHSIAPFKDTIVSIRYFSLTGIELRQKPISGIYIQKTKYANGFSETKKVLEANK